MEELKLELRSADRFRVLAVSKPGKECSIVYCAPYADGDFIMLQTNKKCKYVWVKYEDSMPAVLLYVPGSRSGFHIPKSDQRTCYSPKSFSGNCHVIRAWAATVEEITHRRNLAFNPYDTAHPTGAFPHASSSVETADPTFAARNAIDGVYENSSHGEWPYQAWGINKDLTASFKVEFGRPVTIDEIRLTTRSDFPHDSWWTEVTLGFSDGTVEVINPSRTGYRQSFTFKPKTTEWVELKDMKKADDESMFPALTQLEVYGADIHP